MSNPDGDQASAARNASPATPVEERKAPLPGEAIADRNLLFGILALQMDFIGQDALIAGMNAWVFDKARPLGEILVEHKRLAAEHRDLLEPLVAAHLKRHDDDAEKSLATLSSVAAVHGALEQVTDPDIAASLGHLSVRPSGSDQDSTMTYLPGKADSAVGRFRILRRHAKGGLGLVSVALDEELHREVAFKEIQPSHANDPASRERFVAEAEITGGLEHPGIVPVYGLGQYADGRPFYAMRFIRGDSLKTAIEAYHRPHNQNRRDPGAGQLELRQLLGRFIDICNAVEYAHSRGVLHRDLKPGNVMVGKYGETLVVDWGLAKSVGRKEVASDEVTLRPNSALSSSGQTQPGKAIGTPAYMSPEQAAGRLEELGPATDIYGLGATLYHVLTGEPPFKGRSDEVLPQVIRGEIPPPRGRNPEVPRGLEAICLKAMALKPTDRYVSARSLASDLEHWLADEPVAAAPDTLNDRLGRFVRKHRGYVQAGAVAVILVAVVSFVAALLINEQRRQTANLAFEKGKLAEKNARLADSEREAKTQAQKLAETNGRLARDEEKARVAMERQLRFATAERLAALSATMESPELALLLALESGNATRQNEEGLLASSHQALLDALGKIGGRPLVGHQGKITSLAISPDSRWVVTGSTENTARIWDLKSSAAARVLSGHQGIVSSVAVSPDNRWVVTGSYDKTARVWDLTAPDPSAAPRILTGHRGEIRSVAISPDSRWVITAGDDKTARIWEIAAENSDAAAHVLSGHEARINVVATTLDGRWVVTASDDRTARVWDLRSENPAAGPRVLGGHEAGITSVAISPDSRWIVTTSLDKTARVWDLAADDPGAEPRVLRHNFGNIACVAISRDSRRVVTGGYDNSARIWDLTANNPPDISLVLDGHEHSINCVAISSDGHWVVTGSQDETARLWDLTAEDPGKTGRVLRGHHGIIYRVAISPDSRWVVTGSFDGSARIWDITSENDGAISRVLRGHQSAVNAVAISRNGQWAVTASDDKTARVWDLTAEHASEKPRILRGHQNSIASLAISPDSRWIVTGSHDKTARIWDLAAEDINEASRGLTAHQALISSAAISPDNRWLVTGSFDATARVWDLRADDPAAPPRVLSGHQSDVNSVAISSDGRWVVTGSSDKTARIWDLTSDNPSATGRILSGHQGLITSVAISPDNRWAVTGSFDNTARIWDLAAPNPGDNPRVLNGHQAYVIALAISPDSRWLVTGSSDKTARVWSLAAESPGAEARMLSGHVGPIQCMAISTDSRWVVTGSHDKTVRVWDLTAPDPSATVRVLFDQGDTRSVAISPDSRSILTGSADGTARVWRWQWDDLVALASPVGRNFSRAEWDQYFVGVPYRKTFADLPVPGDPQTGPEYLNRANRLYSAGEFNKALDDYTAAIRLDPAPFAAYLYRALILCHKGNFAAACDDFAIVVERDPGQPNHWYNAAVAELASGRLGHWREICGRAIRQFEMTDDAAIAARVLYTVLPCDELDEAMAATLAHLAGLVQPKYRAGTYRLVGAVRFRQKEYQAALEQFNESEKSYPSRAWDFLFLAMIHDRLGHADDVRRYLDRAAEWVKSNPNMPWTERAEIDQLRREAEALIRQSGSRQ